MSSADRSFHELQYAPQGGDVSTGVGFPKFIFSVATTNQSNVCMTHPAIGWHLDFI